jgi:hypothetical protein
MPVTKTIIRRKGPKRRPAKDAAKLRKSRQRMAKASRRRNRQK